MQKTTDIKQFYIRLLNYENACKIIEFVNNNDKNDYANIVGGGINLQVSEENIGKVFDYIETLNCKYEITFEHPENVNKSIIERLNFKNNK